MGALLASSYPPRCGAKSQIIGFRSRASGFIDAATNTICWFIALQNERSLPGGVAPRPSARQRL